MHRAAYRMTMDGNGKPMGCRQIGFPCCEVQLRPTDISVTGQKGIVNRVIDVEAFKAVPFLYFPCRPPDFDCDHAGAVFADADG